MEHRNINHIGVDCCGCGNCANACPRQAVTMIPNVEGFIYPDIASTCVNCGICVKVCPQIKDLNNLNKQLSYAAVTKDDDILKNAASGGVFGSISKLFLSQDNAYVCAATFSNGIVKHIVTDSLGDIKKFQGSKYVQSNLGECFPKIKSILKEGSKVLFCGTPCQVAALYSFVGYRPSNLFTLDLICHGVPSPMFLNKDIKHYCNDFNKLKDLRFRWKNPQKPRSSSGFFLYFNMNHRSELYSSSYDPYFATFMRGESFRLSCYQCRYANIKRVGDITIGDFDSYKDYPNFHPGEGKSTVIINSINGLLLWEQSKNLFDFIEIDLIREASVSHQLAHPFEKSSIRETFYQDVKNMSFHTLRKKYALPISKQQRILFTIQTYFPALYKMIILKKL